MIAEPLDPLSKDQLLALAADLEQQFAIVERPRHRQCRMSAGFGERSPVMSGR